MIQNMKSSVITTDTPKAKQMDKPNSKGPESVDSVNLNCRQHRAQRTKAEHRSP